MTGHVINATCLWQPIFPLDVTSSCSNSYNGLERPGLVMSLLADHGPRPGDPFHGAQGVAGTGPNLPFVSPGFGLLGGFGQRPEGPSRAQGRLGFPLLFSHRDLYLLEGLESMFSIRKLCLHLECLVSKLLIKLLSIAAWMLLFSEILHFFLHIIDTHWRESSISSSFP